MTFASIQRRALLVAFAGPLVARQSMAASNLKLKNTEIAQTNQVRTEPIKKAWFVQGLASFEVGKGGAFFKNAGANARSSSAKASVNATHWSRQALKLVVKYQQNPLRAARVFAHLHVSQHDAWLHASKLSIDKSACELASHRAASLVLDHFYPNETPGNFEAQYIWLATGLARDRSIQRVAENIGDQVASSVINRSLRDGAGRTWPLKNRPKEFVGMWQAAYPLYAVNPVEAFAGEWTPWIAPQANRYQPPTAARPNSSLHRQDTNEVQKISSELTVKERDIALRWNLDAGSVTPGGIWLQLAVDKLNEEKIGAEMSETSFEDCLAVLATLSVALEDAFIACWKIKFRDWSERPITAIRRDFDSSYAPLLVTPGFPSYVSGHATISAAAALVLSAFWPSEAATLASMAREAAMSRLWGGIHFRSDNEEGLRLGDAVGKEVLSQRSTSPLA